MSNSSSTPPPQPRLHRNITDAALPPLGASWEDHFENTTPFKEGGGGVLYRTRDRNLNREVILKLLKEEHRDSPDVTRRFLREARVTALLQHPATVPIYEMGQDPQGNPYFTMKEIRGESLSAILKGITARNREMDRFRSREVLIDLLIQVGQALAYAHSCGVVHRDIKPGNIMVGAFGEVLVMDWGVAKIMDGVDDDEESEALKTLPSLEGDIDDTEYGKVYGTPRYMAPEQARGHTNIDERVDIFSLGAVLYECLIYRPLVFGANRDELLKKICDEPFISPATKEPYRMIPPELDAIVMKALAKDPDNRYKNMTTFVADLQRYRRGETVSVMCTSFQARAQRWIKTNLPLKRSSILVSIGLVIGLLIGRF
ncbi:serine/threonine-protein kinase [Kiritimatiellota bacterium B12222]|nr:serine/threonine-protein kinase [Kiritimatiellota bacterium B12222]